jgi:hypothetical protein
MLLRIGSEPVLELAHHRRQAGHFGDRIEQRSWRSFNTADGYMRDVTANIARKVRFRRAGGRVRARPAMGWAGSREPSLWIVRGLWVEGSA